VPPRATSGEKFPAEAPPHAATPSPEVTNRDNAQRGPVDAIVSVNITLPCHRQTVLIVRPMVILEQRRKSPTSAAPGRGALRPDPRSTSTEHILTTISQISSRR
jgi:hypothetical protein